MEKVCCRTRQSAYKVKKFKYLESVLQENGKIVENLASRIIYGWMKWREATEVLCEKKDLKVKRRLYKTIV